MLLPILRNGNLPEFLQSMTVLRDTLNLSATSVSVRSREPLGVSDTVCISPWINGITAFVMHGFLSKASCLLGKDVATVRRWCERGFIPGAYRTAGGHWRANGFNATTADAVLRRVRDMGFSRKKIALSTTARVRQNRRKLESYRLARELRMSEEKLTRKEVQEFISQYARNNPNARWGLIEALDKKFSSEQADQILARADYGDAFNRQPAVMALNAELGRTREPIDPFQNLHGKAKFIATVTVCSRRLHLTGAKPTRKNLASEMGIAEVTLKRRFKLWRFGMSDVKRHFAEWIGVASTPPSPLESRSRRSPA